MHDFIYFFAKYDFEGLKSNFRVLWKGVVVDVLNQVLMTQLRDKTTDRVNFRIAAEKLVHVVACKAAEKLQTKQVEVQTPIAATEGVCISGNTVLVPILRSGLAMLPVFLKYFPKATVGMVGLMRDEKTAKALQYYEKLPPIGRNDKVIILDPMVATGGTAVSTLKILKDKGIDEQQILFVAIIGVPEGIALVTSKFPGIELVVSVVDKGLDDNYFIVPGLGDFWDRYFGT
jgi:uracil phosphoribosyltransferase